MHQPSRESTCKLRLRKRKARMHYQVVIKAAFKYLSALFYFLYTFKGSSFASLGVWFDSGRNQHRNPCDRCQHLKNVLFQIRLLEAVRFESGQSRWSKKSPNETSIQNCTVKYAY